MTRATTTAATAPATDGSQRREVGRFTWSS
jgi:hypothetical protein